METVVQPSSIVDPTSGTANSGGCGGQSAAPDSGVRSSSSRAPNQHRPNAISSAASISEGALGAGEFWFISIYC